jgi:hypothetical protein
MTVALTINGTIYNYPETGDLSWGPDATDWALAVTSGMLQKAGGTFQLLAELDFGTAYGIKSLYYKTRTTNNASAGQYRLARADVISWRNQANSGNLDLSVDSSNNLFFNGVPLVSLFTGVTDTNSIDLTLTGTVLSADLKLSSAAAGAGNFKTTLSIASDGLLSQTPIATTSLTGVLSSTDWTTFNAKQAAGNYITALTGDVTASGPGSVAATIAAGVIVNSMVSASAAIAYSKLALTGSIVNADINTSAAIAFSKLASLTSANILVGSAGNVATAVAVTGDIGLSNAGVTAIQANVIVNAMVSASAAIARSKLASGSNNHVIINDGSGVMSSEATLAKSRGGSGQDNSSITFPSSGTLATLAGTEAFTNKDYQGGTASNTSRFTTPSNTKANLDALTRKAATLVYGTDTSLLYVDNGANLVAVGSGTSGATNYITNNVAQFDTSGWATYANTAGVAPTTGTGGSPTVTWTRSTSSPLAGVANFVLTKDAANRQGEGVAYAFTSNAEDQGNVDYFSCTYQTSANYVDGDVRFYLVDVTNSVVIEPVNVQLPANGQFGRQVSYFQLSSNSVSYRLCVHVASTSALAYTIKMDSFFFGPQNLYTGAIITDWQSYTPIFTGFGTTSGAVAQWRRVGSSVEVEASFTCGTPTGVEARISLPSGTTIASTVTALTLVGFGDRNSTAIGWNILASAGNTYFNMDQPNNTGIIARNADLISAAGEVIKFKASAAIQGWSPSITVASQATNQIIAFKAGLTANQAIATASATKVAFNSTVGTVTGRFDTAGAFDTVNNRFVAPQYGVYYFSAKYIANSNVTASSYYTMQLRKNGTNVENFRWYFNDTVGQWIGSMTIVLNQNDYVEVFNIGDASYDIIGTDIADGAVFEGYRINGNQTIGMDEVVSAAYLDTSAAASSGVTIMKYLTKQYDTHNAYNTSTGEYTIPVAGKYLLTMCVESASRSVSSGDQSVAYFYKNGTLIVNAGLTFSTYTGRMRTPPLSDVLDLVKGDIITFRYYFDGNPNTSNNLGSIYMSVARIK